MGYADDEKKGKDIFDRYVVEEMSLSKFMNALSIEICGYEKDNIDSDIKNKRKKLDQILKKLGMYGIIENILNRDGRAIKLPVYQRIFFRKLLICTDLKEDEFVMKLIKKA